MSTFIERTLSLWDGDAAAQDDALARFREVYADVLRVNGTVMPVRDMVERARALGAAFADRRTVIHDVVEGDGFLGFAFEIRARHTGPWPSPDGGTLEPTGRAVVVQGLDIFRLDDEGRVATIWAVNDLADALIRTG